MNNFGYIEAVCRCHLRSLLPTLNVWRHRTLAAMWLSSSHPVSIYHHTSTCPAETTTYTWLLRQNLQAPHDSKRQSGTTCPEGSAHYFTSGYDQEVKTRFWNIKVFLYVGSTWNFITKIRQVEDKLDSWVMDTLPDTDHRKLGMSWQEALLYSLNINMVQATLATPCWVQRISARLVAFWQWKS